jgi:Mn2+/Fe2+ NRAMP family transporter
VAAMVLLLLVLVVVKDDNFNPLLLLLLLLVAVVVVLFVVVVVVAQDVHDVRFSKSSLREIIMKRRVQVLQWRNRRAIWFWSTTAPCQQ